MDKRNDGWSVFYFKATAESTFFDFIIYTEVDYGLSAAVKELYSRGNVLQRKRRSKF